MNRGGAEAVQHVPFNLPENASCSRKQLSQTQLASWDTPNPCSRKQLLLVSDILYFTMMAFIYSLQGKFFHADRVVVRNIPKHTHTHSTINVYGTVHR